MTARAHRAVRWLIMRQPGQGLDNESLPAYPTGGLTPRRSDRRNGLVKSKDYRTKPLPPGVGGERIARVT
jgi:hypothetical protein